MFLSFAAQCLGHSVLPISPKILSTSSSTQQVPHVYSQCLYSIDKSLMEKMKLCSTPYYLLSLSYFKRLLTGFPLSTAYTILAEWTSNVNLLVVVLIIQNLLVLPKCRIIWKVISLITFMSTQNTSSAYPILLLPTKFQIK